MDQMGNANGQLEVSPRPWLAPMCQPALTHSRAPQLNEWMTRVMTNGKDQSDAEFETSLEAWTALIKHKKVREEAPAAA